MCKKKMYSREKKQCYKKWLENIKHWDVTFYVNYKVSTSDDHPEPQQWAQALQWFSRGFLVYDIIYTCVL